MKTEYLYEKTLKEMMSHQNLDTISATSLSDKIGVHKKTFYYHYRDIYDLLTQVFLDEKIKNIEKVNNSDDLLITIYKYYEENSHFIDATINSAGRDLFFEFIYNNCYLVFNNLVVSYKESSFLSIDEKKSIARFIAGGYAYSMLYYFTNYKKKTLNGLLSNFSFLRGNNLECLMKSMRH